MEPNKERIFKQNFIPTKDQEQKLNMFMTEIWKGFPLTDRLWYSFCCGAYCVRPTLTKTKQFPIDEIISNSDEVDPKVDLKNKFISLLIKKSGTLDINSALVHPFVKISIVDLRTLKLLQKADFAHPCFLINENLTQFTLNNQSVNSGGVDIRESPLDFIPPFATAPYDLTIKGESFAEWNEEFIINDDASNVFKGTNVIFFELLDFNLNELKPGSHSGAKGNFVKNNNKTRNDSSNANISINRTNHNFSTHDGQVGVVPLAWGYIRPVGSSQTYLGQFKIQLYKYKFTRTNEFQALKSKSKEFRRTPDVLFEFNWLKREKYQTFLEIELKIEQKPNYEELFNSNNALNYINSARYRNSVFRPEGKQFNKELYRDQFMLDRDKDKLNKRDIYVDYLNKEKKKELLKMKRNQGEDCVLPDKLLYKFNSAEIGCLTHSFSNNGLYLACACTNLASITTIKVFSIEDDAMKYHFQGHKQIIHHLHWSFDDSILVSSSSDNIVSLWNIPASETNNTINTDFRDNDSMFKIHSINHVSYVYSSCFYPDNNPTNRILATACFDGIVRLFYIKLLYNQQQQKFNYMSIQCFKQIKIFEEFIFEDFALNKQKFDKDNLNEIEKATLLERTVLDHRHPNSIIFDESGRLYIGDSLGAIHIWEVLINNAKPICSKIKVVIHKELEGDTINNISIEPMHKRRLLVHSRDNCIRLLDISGAKPKVIVRYFGLECSKVNIKSTISPDGAYVLSGSEDGKPHLWSFLSGIKLNCDFFQCNFVDPLPCVSWNKQFNIIALSGFGQEHPILVYAFKRKELVIDSKDLQIKNPNMNQDDARSHVNLISEPSDDPISSPSNKLQRTPKNIELTALQDQLSDFSKEYKNLTKLNK